MAFVVSAGALAALDRAAPRPGFTLRLSDNLTQDYATIWRTQPGVRTVVGFLARNLAQLGLHFYRRQDDNDRQRLGPADHPLPRLFARPNGFTTPYRLVEALVQDLGIYDNAYWIKVKGEDAEHPEALLRADPRQVTPQGDNPFAAENFEIRGAKGTRTLPADQVVHFRGYNPSNGREGVSSIESLRRILAEEWTAAEWREQLWRNGARTSGFLTRPIEAPKWSDTARNRFLSEWQDLWTGDGPNAGGTPVLEEGMGFTPTSVTPEQAQYIEARKLTREECAAAYYIPPPMVGILDHATFSNIAEQHKHLYQDTLGPWLVMIVQEIALQLFPDFAETTDIYAEFNLGEKLRGSFEEQAAQLQTSVGAPWMTRNEARGRVNLPRIEGGDDLVTPLNVLIGDQASPTDSAPEPSEQDAAGKATNPPTPEPRLRLRSIHPGREAEA